MSNGGDGWAVRVITGGGGGERAVRTSIHLLAMDMCRCVGSVLVPLCSAILNDLAGTPAGMLGSGTARRHTYPAPTASVP